MSFGDQKPPRTHATPQQILDREYSALSDEQRALLASNQMSRRGRDSPELISPMKAGRMVRPIVNSSLNAPDEVLHDPGSFYNVGRAQLSDASPASGWGIPQIGGLAAAAATFGVIVFGIHWIRKYFTGGRPAAAAPPPPSANFAAALPESWEELVSGFGESTP